VPSFTAKPAAKTAIPIKAVVQPPKDGGVKFTGQENQALALPASRFGDRGNAPLVGQSTPKLDVFA
jgi:hypothetical protein